MTDKGRSSLYATAACVFSVMFLFPATAHANAGTPLMWAEAFHLFIGNAVIGLVEGLLLKRLASPKSHTGRLIFVMILANYFSAWLGVLGLEFGPNSFSQVWLFFGTSPLKAAGPMLMLLAFVSYMVTILLEWPFVALATRREDRGASRSLRASAIVQTASYAVLIPCALLLSTVDVFTDTNVDQSIVTEASTNGEVFFIGPEGDAVYRSGLDGSSKALVARLPEMPPDARPAVLFLKRSVDGPYWDLCAGWEQSSKGAREVLREHLVAPRFAGRNIRHERAEPLNDSFPPWNAPRPDLRDSPGQWTASVPHWYDYPSQGIEVTSSHGQSESYRIALDTPFLS